MGERTERPVRTRTSWVHQRHRPGRMKHHIISSRLLGVVSRIYPLPLKCLSPTFASALTSRCTAHSSFCLAVANRLN
jgi:hypothetical protein